MKTKEELLRKLAGKNVYIWGTRTLGMSVYKKLLSWDVEIAGFVDSIESKEELYGKKVLSPQEFYNAENRIVIICTRGFSHIIKAECLKSGVAEAEIIAWTELVQYDYYIATNNRCNLRCCTCGTSTYFNDDLYSMPMEYFEKVIRKISTEDPFVTSVFLYGANEPLLTPDFPEMIKLCKREGFGVGFSSNLTIPYDFAALMRAQPDWVRVSVSGWGKNYEAMHRGGKFSVLLKNLRELSAQRATHAPETVIEIIFHKYRHNAADMPKILELCRELNFETHTIYASILGMEAVLGYLEGRPIPLKMRSVLLLLCKSVEETAERAYAQRHEHCCQKNIIRIESDGTLAECQCWQGSVFPGADYLQTPIAEITRLKAESRLCALCEERGLHMFYAQVFDETNQ